MAAPAATATTSAAKRQELSIQRPSVSPLKRKRSSSSADAAEPTSPTSLDEVANSAPEEGVISPKKKTKKAAADGDLSKWESHVVSSITSSLDLNSLDKDDKDAECEHELEPIAFSAAPAAPLTADELQILRHFLA